MDGGLLATIVTSSLMVGGSIGAGSIALWRQISHHGKSIGRLEGKMDGFDTRMRSYEKQIEGFDKRVDRLDRRINGLLDNMASQGEPKVDK